MQSFGDPSMPWTRAHQAGFLHLFIEVPSPCSTRSPGVLRVPPVNAVEEIPELGRRDGYRIA
jgi:hypothetical protein